MAGAEDKWNRIYANADDSPALACTVLEQYHHLLPANGCALDIACGKGGNALLLAASGLTTSAIDVSSTAIELLQRAAMQQNLVIDTTVTPAGDFLTGIEGGYDVIVVSRFLERDLLPLLPTLLLDNGLLFYQTFVKDKIDVDIGPSNPDYLLNTNELLSICSDLNIRVFSDQGSTGDSALGFRNESYLVAQRGGD